MSSMPEAGRAAVVTAWGSPTEIREYELTPPPPGGLLVRVERATVCGSDVHAWEGALAGGFEIELPIILGHETVGRIVAFGEGARDRLGRQPRCARATGSPGPTRPAATATSAPCWDWARCARTDEIGFLLSADAPPHFHGGFAEYAHVSPGAGRLRIPDDVESEWAAAASCALRTVVDAVERLGRVDYRHTVVIQGAGPVGLFATAMLVGRPGRASWSSSAVPRRGSRWRARGAPTPPSTSSRHPTPEARREAVLSIVGARGADVVCEMSGARGAVAEGLRLAAPAGALPGRRNGRPAARRRSMRT